MSSIGNKKLNTRYLHKAVNRDARVEKDNYSVINEESQISSVVKVSGMKGGSSILTYPEENEVIEDSLMSVRVVTPDALRIRDAWKKPSNHNLSNSIDLYKPIKK